MFWTLVWGTKIPHAAWCSQKHFLKNKKEILLASNSHFLRNSGSKSLDRLAEPESAFYQNPQEMYHSPDTLKFRKQWSRGEFQPEQKPHLYSPWVLGYSLGGGAQLCLNCPQGVGFTTPGPYLLIHIQLNFRYFPLTLRWNSLPFSNTFVRVSACCVTHSHKLRGLQSTHMCHLSFWGSEV